MEVYKKINNNVALARDAKGRELVVFGQGHRLCLHAL